MSNKKVLPILESIEVNTPCNAAADKFHSIAGGQFCRSCQSKVWDLSTMTPLEIYLLIVAKRGQCCVRITRSEDNSIQTATFSLKKEIRISFRAAWTWVLALLLSICFAARPAKGEPKPNQSSVAIQPASPTIEASPNLTQSGTSALSAARSSQGIPYDRRGQLTTYGDMRLQHSVLLTALLYI
jgi:hypothetical protein